MVGDHWDWDVVPPVSLGLSAYWIASDGNAPPDDSVPLAGHGTLADFWEWVGQELDP